MKRLLFFICTLLCANVLFAQRFWEGDLVYEVIGAGEVEVSGYYYIGTSVNIPSSVTHNWVDDSVRTYSVTSIGENAFGSCSSLTSVTIPNSVNTIGNGAFHWCTSLTSITIPNSVTSIGGGAFDLCSSLTSVTIPNSVTSIGDAAFSWCSSLTSIDIPNSVTSIGDGIFYGCSSLTSVTIPNSVTSIGNRAFFDCSSLTSVTIPNSVTSIGGAAFYGCSSLTSVTLSNNITGLPHYHGNNYYGFFENCSSLTSVTIPNSVTSIGEEAFTGCSSLTTLNYNAINCNDFDYYDQPFENCPITTINIGDSVQRIPNYAFRGCSSLTTLNYNAINCNNFDYDYLPFENCPITTINIGNSVQRIPNYFACNLDSLTCVTIGNNVTEIGIDAFAYCYRLTSVNIPNSVTSIGEGMLFGCTRLTYVNIPNSVTTIGEWAFGECWSLTSVTIPNSVTSIGNYAFYNCSSLTSVTLPENITYIGVDAFYDAGVDASVIIDSVTYRFSPAIIPDSYYANLTDGSYHISGYRFITFHIGDSTYAPKARVYDCEQSRSGHVDILSSIEFEGNTYPVTSIGGSAFYNCSSLTSITIPNSVTSIGGYAFRNCSSLTTLNYNAINCNFDDYDNTFENCPISTINIGDSVQRIPNDFAYNLDSLTSVTIPNSVTSIGQFAFSGCSSLTSITIPNSVTSIGSFAFSGCSSLTTLNYNAINCNGFYNNFTEYLQGYYPFEYCPITTINIGDSVQRIPNNFAYNLDSLTSITIPNSVDTIGDSAFYNCSSLTSITCLADIPPALGNNVFNNTPSNKILYVNCGLKDDYISSWGDYFNSNNIQEITFDINTYVNNESGGSVAIERNNCSTATLTATANICYQFVRWNDGNTENPRVVYLSSDTSFTAIFDSILFDTNINATINAGETYTEFGFDVNEEGTYTRIFITEDGCDSIVTLTLNIIPVFNTELSATICEGQTYTENGFNVSEAGVYTQILTASNGFDSIVTLSLSVNPVYNTELSATICQGQVYNEQGFNVSEAGVYTQTLTSTNGCDSIVSLTLNVNPVFNTELTATICEGQVYNEQGFNVSEAGVYTQTLTSANGCDSIVTLTLNVNPIFNTELTVNICEGQVYNEQGFNVSEAGVYTQTLQTINGCDSIVTLTLNVNPVYNTELTTTICEGQVYNEQGFNVSEAGVYTQTLQTINGCDSIVTLTVSVNPTFDTTINATINAGETYAEYGFNESEAGTYIQNLQTINGCDSTITLVLSVNSSLLDVEQTEISFYPNPTDSKVIFSQMIEKIEVIDLTGKTIFTFTNAKTINIESLPSGAYYLRLTNNDKAIMRKVIKE